MPLLLRLLLLFCVFVVRFALVFGVAHAFFVIATCARHPLSDELLQSVYKLSMSFDVFVVFFFCFEHYDNWLFLHCLTEIIYSIFFLLLRKDAADIGMWNLRCLKKHSSTVPSGMH